MANRLPKVGLAQLMKEGSNNLQGQEEAVYKNTSACRELSNMLKTSLGPNGMNKMVVNHLEKLFVTKDAATIVQELDVEHPAAKLVVMAAKDQAMEMGDGTSFVIVFAGELLGQAEELLKQGLTVQDVRRGYELANDIVLETLMDDSVVAERVTTLDAATVTRVVTPVVNAKLNTLGSVVAPLIGQAVDIVSRDGTFSTSSIQVIRMLGSSITQSCVERGSVVHQVSRTSTRQLKDAKFGIYSCPLDYEQMETKGTVLLESAEDLLNYTKSEEAHMEGLIQAIADSGVNVIVTGNSIGDLALHYCDMKGILVLKIQSKFELRRFASSVGASILVNLVPPTEKQAGHSDEVFTREYGDVTCTIARNDPNPETVGMATVVLRAATKNLIDDVDRTVANGINMIYHLTKDDALVSGGGAIEMHLSRTLIKIADATPDLSQYAIRAYATALQQIPRVLAETSGKDPTVVVADLLVAHHEGRLHTGVEIDDPAVMLADMKAKGVLDHRGTKFHAIQSAAQAAMTVLSVDQLIMSKPAGGPAPRG